MTEDAHDAAARARVTRGPGGRMPVPRRIVDFRHDADEDQWIAVLECGHTQHVRHDPPWQVRPWVITAEGRARHLGAVLLCRQC